MRLKFTLLALIFPILFLQGQNLDFSNYSKRCFINADYVNPDTKKINYKAETSELCVEILDKEKIKLTVENNSQVLVVIETIQIDVTPTDEKVYKALVQVGFDKFEIFYIDYGANDLNPFMVHIYNRFVENFEHKMIIQYKSN